MPIWFLAPIAGLKLPTQITIDTRKGSKYPRRHPHTPAERERDRGPELEKNKSNLIPPGGETIDILQAR
jgi:hypothetical protein